MRAGDLGLSLLSAPSNVVALRALEAGPTSLAAGSQPVSPGGIRPQQLVDLGVVEHRSASDDYEITRSGGDLLRVARVLQRWLEVSPRGPLGLGTKPARACILALLGGWSAGIVRAFAARPFSGAELQRLIPGLDQPSLDARLLAMSDQGLIEAKPGEDDRLLAATDWLRLGVGPLAASARWERQHLSAETSPIAPIDVESAFLLAIPLLELAEAFSGVCRLVVVLPGVVSEPGGEMVGVVVRVRRGTIASCTSRLSVEAETRAEGSSRAWLRAVLDGDLERLQLAGDEELLRALLGALTRVFQEDGRSTENHIKNLDYSKTMC